MPRPIGFNNVAERDKYYAGLGNAKPTPTLPLGPGTYNVTDNETPFRPAPAPFNVTAQRQEPDADAIGPGPAAYSANKPGGWNRGGARGAFKSKFNRFKDEKKAEFPGPGKYVINKSEMDMKLERHKKTQTIITNHKKNELNGLQWVRLPSAPTIPGHHNAYGYEEGPYGELVLQRPAFPGYTGVKDDKVSPADYSPNINAIRPKKGGIDFGRGSAREGNQIKSSILNKHKQKDELLAEEYSKPEKKEVHFIRHKTQQSAAFASKTKRGVGSSQKSEEKDRKVLDMPGPGEYVLPSSIGMQYKRKGQENFNSSAKRFVMGPREAMRLYGGPGPGSYAMEKAISSFTNKEARRKALVRVVNSPTSIQPIGFTGGATRFQEISAKDVKPDPGEYVIPGLSNEVQKKKQMASRVAVFGSTTKRFAGSEFAADLSSKKKGSNSLGVASNQNEESATNNMNNIKTKSKLYSSTTKNKGGILGNIGRVGGGGWNFTRSRETSLKNSHNQGSNSYPPNDDLESDFSKTKLSSSFASTSKRSSPDDHAVYNVGPPPGKYNVGYNWLKKGTSVNIAKQAQRFERGPDEFERSRGPGQYSIKSAFGADKTNSFNKYTRSKKNIMISSDQRFKEQKQSLGPAPGEYAQIYDTMIKQTYNVAIASGAKSL